MASAPPPRVVVCGGGIAGVSTAFYLARRGCRPVVLDRAGVAAAASGKAGGFLAADWLDGTRAEALARASFKLHAELAEEFGAEALEYRRLTAAAVAVGAGALGKPSNKKLQEVEWADKGAGAARQLGGEDTIAQVHPRKLVEAMAADAEGRGATFRTATVTAVEPGAPARVRVRARLVDGGGDAREEVLEADAVVVAMGPWTTQVCPDLGIGPVVGQKYHSVVMRARRTLGQAAFCQGATEVEIYPRPHGAVYVTGYPDPAGPVREEPGREEAREDRAAQLEREGRALSTALAEAEVEVRQACYLPVRAAGDGQPAVGKVAQGLFVATGHSCWGILNGPATGKALAALILDGDSSLRKGKDAACIAPLQP